MRKFDSGDALTLMQLGTIVAAAALAFGITLLVQERWE